MGKKDIAVCKFLSDKDRFAEIVNAAEFGGAPVLRGDMLEAEDGRYADIRSEGGRGKKVSVPQMRFRDVKMRTKSGEWLVLTAIENQENIDYTMPLRIMEYDCMEYRSQVRRIRADKEKALVAEGVKPCAFNAGVGKKDKLHPVHTVCFYHGTESWDGPRSLKDMMDFENAPPGWQERFHNYEMSLFCAGEVADLSQFKTGVRQMLEVIPLRKNKKKLIELWSHEEYRHLDRDTAEVIAILTDTNYVLERLDEYEKEGEYDMCQAMDEWREELLAEGKEKSILSAIRSLMQTLHFTVEQAMEALQVPEEEWGSYRTKI